MLSIEQWTNAFHIFMVIYIEKKPQAAPHLLKYISTIREIASSNGDAAWRHYDDIFRMLRQSHTLPWQRTVCVRLHCLPTQTALSEQLSFQIQ